MLQGSHDTQKSLIISYSMVLQPPWLTFRKESAYTMLEAAVFARGICLKKPLAFASESYSSELWGQNCVLIFLRLGNLPLVRMSKTSNKGTVGPEQAECTFITGNEKMRKSSFLPAPRSWTGGASTWTRSQPNCNILSVPLSLNIKNVKLATCL